MEKIKFPRWKCIHYYEVWHIFSCHKKKHIKLFLWALWKEQHSKDTLFVLHVKNSPAANSASVGHLSECSHTLNKHKHQDKQTHSTFTHMRLYSYSHTHLPVSTPENSTLFLLPSLSSLLPHLSHSLAPSGDDSLACRAAPLHSAGSVFVSCSFEVLI